jgi:hypothetical protein
LLAQAIFLLTVGLIFGAVPATTPATRTYYDIQSILGTLNTRTRYDIQSIIGKNQRLFQ